MSELQVIEQNAIVVAFQKKMAFKICLIVWLNRHAQSCRMSQQKGRDAIASQAYKVSKSKTAVDNHGKDLVAGIKAQAALIDKDRKAWRDQCDALRDEIRKPLDDWEQAETDRVSLLTGRIDLIKGFAITQDHHTAKDIQDSLNILDGMQIDETYQEFEQEAKIAKLETLEKLRTALAAREKYEAEQAELERLRQAEIERKQKERDEAIARQAAEKHVLKLKTKQKPSVNKLKS